jgi:hypothetical protein
MPQGPHSVNSHILQPWWATTLAASLAATLVAGCACTDHCGPADACCFVDWPCFGYHSTCWRPWPEECVACPSPYLMLVQPAEAVPAPATPDSQTPDRGLPVQPSPEPMPPMPVPMPAIPAAPGAPPGVAPAMNIAPLPEAHSSLGPGNVPEASSRRRNTEGTYSLGGLRWAPAGNP